MLTRRRHVSLPLQLRLRLAQTPHQKPHAISSELASSLKEYVKQHLLRLLKRALELPLAIQQFNGRQAAEQKLAACTVPHTGVPATQILWHMGVLLAPHLTG